MESAISSARETVERSLRSEEGRWNLRLEVTKNGGTRDSGVNKNDGMYSQE
jgi:hypothetical protein